MPTLKLRQSKKNTLWSSSFSLPPLSLLLLIISTATFFSCNGWRDLSDIHQAEITRQHFSPTLSLRDWYFCIVHSLQFIYPVNSSYIVVRDLVPSKLKVSINIFDLLDSFQWISEIVNFLYMHWFINIF